MAVRWAVASGNWSTGSTWNDGAILGIPTASDDVFTNTFTVNINQSFEVLTLRNTARARDIATPQMSANNIPTPYVAAASSIRGGTSDAWLAFDRSTGTAWSTARYSVTGWLSFDFGSGSSVVVDGYTIYGGGQLENPRFWSLQGSDDNTSWTNLHIVSGAAAIPSSGTYSIASIGNSTGYRYYRLNITLNGGSGDYLVVAELELYQPGTVALSAGGSFIFNSGSISGSCTSTTTALAAGATNLIQVTATTGSVTLNLSSNVSGQIAGNLFLHSGNCDLILNGQNFSGGSTGMVCMNKTSAGTITINGNLSGGINTGPTGLISNNGNTVIIGNVTGTTNLGINQSAGNLTVTGNITGGTASNITGVTLSGAASQFTVLGNVTGGTSTNTFGISHSGTSGSVIGNVTGGSGTTAHGISTVGNVTVTGNVTGGTAGNAVITSGPLTSINGTVTGGTVAAISSTSANQINVSGSVIASANANGISSTAAAGIVILEGNMFNNAGKQAIYCQNLFLSDTGTTQAQFFTSGSQDRTLYSANTFPNLPSGSNVRSTTSYGPGNELLGSLIMPVPANVRYGVPTDNTTGSALLSAENLFDEIATSNNPVAVRLRNSSTSNTIGNLLTAFKK